MIDLLPLSSAPSAPGHGHAPGRRGGTSGHFEKTLGAVVEARDTTTAAALAPAAIARQAVAVGGKGLPQVVPAKAVAADGNGTVAVQNPVPSPADPTIPAFPLATASKAAQPVQDPAATLPERPAPNVVPQADYRDPESVSAKINADGISLATGPTGAAPIAFPTVATPTPFAVPAALQSGTGKDARAPTTPVATTNPLLVAAGNTGVPFRSAGTTTALIAPATPGWRDKAQDLRTGASSAAMALANAPAQTTAPQADIGEEGPPQPALAQRGELLAPTIAALSSGGLDAVIANATPQRPGTVTTSQTRTNEDGLTLLPTSSFTVGNADSQASPVATIGASAASAQAASIGPRVQTLAAFLNGRDATVAPPTLAAAVSPKAARSADHQSKAVRVDAQDVTPASLANLASPLVAPTIAPAPVAVTVADPNAAASPTVTTIASLAAAQRPVSITTLESASTSIATAAPSPRATPGRIATPETAETANDGTETPSPAPPGRTPAAKPDAILQSLRAPLGGMLAAQPPGAPTGLETQPLSITLPDSSSVATTGQPKPPQPAIVATAPERSPLPAAPAQAVASLPIPTPTTVAASPLPQPLRVSDAIAPVGQAAAASAPAAPLPIVAASSPSALPTSAPLAAPTPGVDRSDTPSWVAQRDAAVPTITVSTTPQPAGQVFAAAIAAATSWRSKPALPGQGDAALLAAALSTAPAANLPDQTAVAATGSTNAAPLDLRQDPGLQRMIDHIETLRDDANAHDTRIKLSPDALGSVDVAVRQEGDRVHVRFTTEHEATRALIAEAQPRLTELASARGVRIGDTSVTADSAGGGNGAAPQPRPTPQPSRTPPRARSDATDDPVDHRLA
ncbi:MULTISPECIES: flagellar hook-length control protein FliK [Sphingomonas]|jgi:flagellar hook-length control protein FliK|uniref:flagellar hook-length control protein FliK n=2 Tax=Pseudomonadota TaxID=1224 RepID=UPI001AE97EEF